MYRGIARIWVLALIVSTAASAQTPITYTLHGMLKSAGVTGRNAAPHGWLEEMVYAVSTKWDCGVGVRTSSNPQGAFDMPGDNKDFQGFTHGPYALFALSFDGIPAFSIRTDLRMPKKGPGACSMGLDTKAHYSVMYNKVPDEWGRSPYVEGTDFYQTFVATSPYITRVAVKLGGKSGDHQPLTLNYAIYEPNGGRPSTWKQISRVRKRTYGSGVDPIIHIYHVVYRSNEMRLKVGKTYAARFWRDPISKSEAFVIVVRQDKGDGYRGGQLYDGDKPLAGLDAYAYVSGGEPGTIVNHIAITDRDLKTYAGSAQRFGQTFKASGTSLAGVDTIYTDGKTRPSALPTTFQVYERPGGKKIGPERVCCGIPLAFQARVAAAWTPGEVPLTPGKMYYIEWTFPTSWNTWLSNENLPGEAYKDGKAMPNSDLAMSIAEYEGTPAVAKKAK